MTTLIKAAGVSFEPIWPNLFARALEGKRNNNALFYIFFAFFSFSLIREGYRCPDM